VPKVVCFALQVLRYGTRLRLAHASQRAFFETEGRVQQLIFLVFSLHVREGEQALMHEAMREQVGRCVRVSVDAESDGIVIAFFGGLTQHEGWLRGDVCALHYMAWHIVCVGRVWFVFAFDLSGR
jgi:hypothetical protein